MREGDAIAGRYRLEKLLGRGASGSTWRAQDLETGEMVVVKALELRRLKDWKDVELFEREAKVLKNLSHERIPRYVDYFQLELERGPLFVLVQQYIPGTNLQEKVKAGWRGTEEEIKAIGVRILRILSYIHSLRPAIIHRDINPRNLIQREDGEIFLVDFGGVQDAIRLEEAGSATVIGTPGFVPMEQYMGRATERSDLYACAATLLFLLTHRSPADFPLVDMKVDFAGAASGSRELAFVLSNWLEPDEAKRTLPLQKAIALLEGQAQAQPAWAGRKEAVGAAPLSKPRGSRVEAAEYPDGLRIRFRERGKRRLALLGFAAVWLGFVAVWDALAISMGAPIIFPLFSIPFWAVGLFMLYKVLYGLFARIILELSASRGFRFVREFLRKKELAVPLSEVGECAIRSPYTLNNVPQYVLELEVGAQTIKFGEFLSPREKEWLAALINRKVEELAAFVE